jgi:hypothetical protein
MGIQNGDITTDHQIMSDMFSIPTQICMVKEWNVVRDDAQGYLYAYYDDNWVSYDDVSTVTAKVR